MFFVFLEVSLAGSEGNSMILPPNGSELSVMLIPPLSVSHAIPIVCQNVPPVLVAMGAQTLNF